MRTNIRLKFIHEKIQSQLVMSYCPIVINQYEQLKFNILYSRLKQPSGHVSETHRYEIGTKSF